MEEHYLVALNLCGTGQLKFVTNAGTPFAKRLTEAPAHRVGDYFPGITAEGIMNFRAGEKHFWFFFRADVRRSGNAPDETPCYDLRIVDVTEEVWSAMLTISRDFSRTSPALKIVDMDFSNATDMDLLECYRVLVALDIARHLKTIDLRRAEAIFAQHLVNHVPTMAVEKEIRIETI